MLKDILWFTIFTSLGAVVIDVHSASRLLFTTVLYIARVETGSGHLGCPGFSGSNESGPLYKICRSDLDSALDHVY